MRQIPLQAVPSQQLQVVLAGQNCQIAIYQKTQGMFADLNSNGVDISVGILARNGVPLTCNYSRFVGNLVIIDTQGSNDPTYDGLGSRYQLVYLTATELASMGKLRIMNSYVPVPPQRRNLIFATASGNYRLARVYGDLEAAPYTGQLPAQTLYLNDTNVPGDVYQVVVDTGGQLDIVLAPTQVGIPGVCITDDATGTVATLSVQDGTLQAT